MAGTDPSAPRPRGLRRGPRRRRPGIVSWPLYRLLAVLALIPPVIAALTLSGTPQPPLPVQQLSVTGASVIGSATRVFDAEHAVHGACCQPGSPGDQAAAAWMEQALTGFDPHVQQEQFAAVPAGQTTAVAMTNVIAYRPGTQAGLIAVIAHRDGPGADNAATSGMLVQLARALAPFIRQRGIVLVSTDGGTTGGQGAAYFASHWPLADRINGAIVITSPAAPPGTPLSLQTRSQVPVGTSPTLVASAAEAASQYAGTSLIVPGWLNQAVGYAVPYAPTEQGPLLAHRIPAVTIEAGPPGGRAIGLKQLDAGQLGRTGTTVANLVAALDTAPSFDPGGPPLLVMSGDRFLPALVVEAVLAVLLAPALAAMLDMVARLRRRRLALAPGLAALAWRFSSWVVALAAVWLVSVLPGHPLPPASNPPLPGRTGVTLVGILLAVALALLYWRFIVQPRLVRRAPVAAWERTGGFATGLLGLGLASLLLLAVNPYALLLVLPAAHAWLWLPSAARRGRGLAIAVYLVGLLGPVIVLFEMATTQGLGWDATRAVVAVVSSGYQSPALSLCYALASAAAAQVATTVAGRYGPPRPPGSRASATYSGR